MTIIASPWGTLARAEVNKASQVLAQIGSKIDTRIGEHPKEIGEGVNFTVIFHLSMHILYYMKAS
jgi:hypothetical protein